MVFHFELIASGAITAKPFAPCFLGVCRTYEANEVVGSFPLEVSEMKVFFAAMLVGFACVGAYVCGEKATPLVQDAAVRSYRTVTQQDEIDRLKAELEAAKAANAERAALPTQVAELSL